MDMQKCAQCGKEFDFDEEGLGSSNTGKLVCSSDCAKKLAASHGTLYAIHDHEDRIVDTNAENLKRGTDVSGSMADS